jgi:DNA (cytosine-5)-methyltransferase 1
MIKLFEMFAGYGGASFSLKKAGINFECVGYSEIDKFAIKCYKQNHGDKKNYGNCTMIDPGSLPDFDLLTGGFPCQAFSVAGKGLGEKDPRGKLFKNIINVAETKKPKYMLLENVRGLASKRHEETLKKILEELKRIGYFVHLQILNSANYGTPQKRERLYFVCFRDKAEFDNFIFPQKEKLKEGFAKSLLENGIIDRDASLCITSTYFKGNTLPGYLEKAKKQIIFGDKIIVPNATKLGYKFAEIGDFVLLSNPTSKTNRGRVQKEALQTLTTQGAVAVVEKDDKKGIYFRNLSGKECFRFMGFFNDEINLDGLSELQKKKLAGNGWEINLISKIFMEMIKDVQTQ